MWAESILSGILAGGSTSTLIIWLTKSILSERIKNSIKYEYDVKFESYKSLLESEYNKQLEIFKSQISAQELINQSLLEIKRKACLKALDIVDSFWSNIKWTGKDSQGREIDPNMIEKQPPPSITDIRNCYNSLALSCKNDNVLSEYKRCLKISGDFKGDAIVDLRNAIRKELGFGSDIDFDRKNAFIARVNKPNN